MQQQNLILRPSFIYNPFFKKMNSPFREKCKYTYIEVDVDCFIFDVQYHFLKVE